MEYWTNHSFMDSKHLNLVLIGKQIRKIRKLKGLSQEDVAMKSYFGRSYYGRIERGEVNLSVQSLIQLAYTLKVDVKELLPDISALKKPKNSPIRKNK